MLNDKIFIDRIARALYAQTLQLENDAWDKLSDYAKEPWKNISENFISAINRANLGLFDCEDVR